MRTINQTESANKTSATVEEQVRNLTDQWAEGLSEFSTLSPDDAVELDRRLVAFVTPMVCALAYAKGASYDPSPEQDDSEQVPMVVTVGWLRELREALAPEPKA